MRKSLLLVVLIVPVFLWAQNIPPASNNAGQPVEEKSKNEEEAPAIEQIKVNAAKKSSENVKSRDAILKDAEGAKESQNKQAEIQSVSSGLHSVERASSLQRTQRSPTAAQQGKMDEAVDYLEAYAPNSFEYYYYKYAAGNYDVSLISYLKKAEALKPENADVHVQLVAFYTITGNHEKSSHYLKKLVESQRLERSVIAYGKDLLTSVEKNGLLLTHGVDDTYAVLYQQEINGYRNDITVISLELLQSAEYRKMLQSKGLSLPSGTVINVDYLAKFCKLNNSKNLHISLTAPKEYFTSLKDQLYLTGLVFKYSESQIDNFKENNRLYDALSGDCYLNFKDDKAKKLSANYLPMLLQLRLAYERSGKNEKLEELDQRIDRIAVLSGKYEQVQKIKQSN